MLNMVICKAGHRIVAVIIVWLVADIHALDAGFLGGFFKVLGEELALFVEVVSSALYIHISICFMDAYDIWDGDRRS